MDSEPREMNPEDNRYDNLGGLLLSMGPDGEGARWFKGCLWKCLIVVGYFVIYQAFHEFGGGDYAWLALGAVGIAHYAWVKRKQSSRKDGPEKDDGVNLKRHHFDGFLFHPSGYYCGNITCDFEQEVDSSYAHSSQLNIAEIHSRTDGVLSALEFRPLSSATPLTIELQIVNSSVNKNEFRIVFFRVFNGGETLLQLDPDLLPFVACRGRRFRIVPKSSGAPNANLVPALLLIAEVVKPLIREKLAHCRLLISPRSSIGDPVLDSLIGPLIASKRRSRLMESLEDGRFIDEWTSRSILELSKSGWEIDVTKAPNLGLAGKGW